MKLSNYAKSNGLSYMQAYRQFMDNRIPDAYKDRKGKIYVKDPQVIPPQQSTNVSVQPFSSNFDEVSQSLVVAEANLNDLKTSNAATRLNRSALTEQFNRYNNIDQGYLPFTQTGSKSGTNLSAKDVIVLAQKAYFNFSTVRNIVDVMTEFCASKIFLTGGNEVSRSFFYSYFNKINLNNFQDRFFREYWRSGNLFIYPLKVRLNKKGVSEWVKEFKLNESLSASRVEIPGKYIILNPADIQLGGMVSFTSPYYSKLLNSYEIENLRNPKNEIDQNIFNSLPSDVKKAIQDGNGVISIPLSTSDIYTCFYKKQDYEAFAVPMVFPVLDDLEWKSELKRIDQAISRTVQQAILLITVGYEDKNGKFCVNKRQIEDIQTIFQNESVGRVLVSDFTTKASFVIPQIGEILNPQKYQVVNEDIKNGLNDILTGGGAEKFANQSIKVKVFMGRLTQAREAFLNDFLIPEIKNISKMLGFKAYPTPKFEDIDLEDSVEWVRAVTRLGEVGVLTPSEVITSVETGRLPTKTESEESQEEYRTLRDKGLYEPITGGPFTAKKLAKEAAKQAEKQSQIKIDPMPKPNGRPPGAGPKITKRKTSPIGTRASLDNGEFSASKIKDNIILAEGLRKEVYSGLKKKFNLKKLNTSQEEVADGIVELVVVNEEPEDWLKSCAGYLSKPVNTNNERVESADEIAAEHGLSNYLAGILLNSRI